MDCIATFASTNDDIPFLKVRSLLDLKVRCAQFLNTIYPFVCVETEESGPLCGSSCAKHGKDIPREEGKGLEHGERNKLPPKKVFVISNESNCEGLDLDRWRDVLMVYLRFGGDNTRRKLKIAELRAKEDEDLRRAAEAAQANKHRRLPRIGTDRTVAPVGSQGYDPLRDAHLPKVGGRAGYYTSFYEEITTLEGQNYLTTRQRQDKEMRDMMNLKELQEMQKQLEMEKIGEKLDMQVEEVLDMLDNAEHSGMGGGAGGLGEMGSTMPGGFGAGPPGAFFGAPVEVPYGVVPGFGGAGAIGVPGSAGIIEKLAAGIGLSGPENPMAALEKAEATNYKGFEAAVAKAREQGVGVDELTAKIMQNEIMEGKKGYLQRTRILLRYGADSEFPDSEGHTPLLLGLRMNLKEVCEILIASRCNINSTGLGEYTPLSFAVKEGKKEFAEMLIIAGADVHLSDTAGRTPLHISVENGAKMITKTLINNGASVNMQDYFGTSPLYYAAGLLEKDILGMLLLSSADVNMRDDSGRTALHHGAELGRAEIVSSLIFHDADVNVQDDFGWTPLYASIKSESAEGLSILIKAGANVNRPAVCGCVPLNGAVSLGKVKMVEKLISAKADLNASGLCGFTPLYEAVRTKNREIVRLLLDARADTNLGDNEGRVPLRIAVECGYAKIVELLVNLRGRGGELNLMDDLGRTPLRVATELKERVEDEEDTHDGRPPPELAEAVRCRATIVEYLIAAGAKDHDADRKVLTRSYMSSKQIAEQRKEDEERARANGITLVEPKPSREPRAKLRSEEIRASPPSEDYVDDNDDDHHDRVRGSSTKAEMTKKSGLVLKPKSSSAREEKGGKVMVKQEAEDDRHGNEKKRERGDTQYSSSTRSKNERRRGDSRERRR